MSNSERKTGSRPASKGKKVSQDSQRRSHGGKRFQILEATDHFENGGRVVDGGKNCGGREEIVEVPEGRSEARQGKEGRSRKKENPPINNIKVRPEQDLLKKEGALSPDPPVGASQKVLLESVSRGPSNRRDRSMSLSSETRLPWGRWDLKQEDPVLGLKVFSSY